MTVEAAIICLPSVSVNCRRQHSQRAVEDLDNPAASVLAPQTGGVGEMSHSRICMLSRAPLLEKLPGHSAGALRGGPGRGRPQFPNGVTSASVSFVSITNTAKSLAGFVLLALALTRWRSPGCSDQSPNDTAHQTGAGFATPVW